MTSIQLPTWVEYIRALGTPIAALLGALFAAYFSFRQWRTAQNKLKLELFQKRLDIFNAAMEIARLMSQEGQIDFLALQEASKGLRGVRWLYNKEVAAALYEINARANGKILEKPFEIPVGMSDAQKLQLASKMIKEAGDRMTQQAMTIAKLCDPFLSLKH